MTPEEYEHLVAEVLRSEGWDAHVTPYVRDYGLDVIAKRDGRRLGVQAKMYGGANRSTSVETVMLTYAAAAYADCGEAMIVTDSRVLDDARQVADKLRVALRVVSAITSRSTMLVLCGAHPTAEPRQSRSRSFGGQLRSSFAEKPSPATRSTSTTPVVPHLESL
jgi:hypothetical protein